MKRVIVHIDRLVLNGVSPEHRHEFAEGLRQELTRVLAEPSVAQHLASRGDAVRLEAERIHITPSIRPVQVGAHAARNIAREIKS